MRILRVTSDLYPSVVGGIGIHAHEMSKRQAELGHDVTVYTSNADHRPLQESRDGYTIFRFNNVLKLMGNSISTTLSSSLLKRRNDFDVVHAHSHLFFSTNMCALLRKIGSPPLVVTNHGLISQTAPLWLQRIYIPTIAKWTFDSADRIACYTEKEKSLLEELGIDSYRISVIHNGIDTSSFVPNQKEEVGNQILWVGRFIPGKGVEYLIHAFGLLLKEHPNLRLLMIGNGPLKRNIEQKIRNMNMVGNVVVKPFVPNSSLPRIYQNSTVFVLPSLNEGVPRTILEAMACGVPVVCTELPHLASIVRDCGLLVPVRDSQALADCISHVISDRDLAQRFGMNGRARVVRDHAWEDTVDKTIELYEEICH